jgi:hypothetical protein
MADALGEHRGLGTQVGGSPGVDGTTAPLDVAAPCAQCLDLVEGRAHASVHGEGPLEVVVGGVSRAADANAADGRILASRTR